MSAEQHAPRDLFALLPAIHRLRDGELAQSLGLARGPLEELLAVFAEQFAVADEQLAQLYDDLFIETCAEWMVPYIGDLIGVEALHGVAPKVASARAEVAHTIAMRRRKGTALVLEQLARDVTGWDARAVEYFQRLATTQHMNHPRLHNLSVTRIRDAAALEWLGGAFDGSARTVDVRRIESGRGRHNIANIGLFLWRIRAHPRTLAPAARIAPRCYRASPLGQDAPLYNRPLAEDDITHLAEPDNVPLPLSRRRLARDLALHHGQRADAAAAVDNPNPSLELWVDGALIARNRVRVCNLSDDGGGWAHTPPPDGHYAIDPVLGRIALPGDAADPAEVRLTWHEGFSADIGGGEYERGAQLPLPPAGVPIARVPQDAATIADALALVAGNGVVEISDGRRYSETLDITVADDGHVTLRAANRCRPLLALTGLTLRGGRDSACTLDGLLISDAALEVPPDAPGMPNTLARLTLIDCTLVPGRALNADASPAQPGQPSLRLALPGLATTLVRTITGGIRADDRSRVEAVDSVIDACDPTLVALAAADDSGAGAALSLAGCTVVGKLHVAEVGTISNSILFATLAAGDSWPVAVRAARRQVGCVRFSWLPFDAIMPARHRCQPVSSADAGRIAPRFSAVRYGTPAYMQLAAGTPAEIARGADDEGEMGVLHHLFQPQRSANLRIRLAEYLRAGLAAGIFNAS